MIDPPLGDRLKTLKLTPMAIGLVILTQAHASEELMEKGGCVACHRIDEKLIGPSYKAVAAKYRSNKVEALAYLLMKVRDGGEGVWGDVPMPANSIEKIDDTDLKTLLEWVLAL
jgi:cytochrome c